MIFAVVVAKSDPPISAEPVGFIRHPQNCSAGSPLSCSLSLDPLAVFFRFGNWPADPVISLRSALARADRRSGLSGADLRTGPPMSAPSDLLRSRSPLFSDLLRVPIARSVLLLSDPGVAVRSVALPSLPRGVRVLKVLCRSGVSLARRLIRDRSDPPRPATVRLYSPAAVRSVTGRCVGVINDWSALFCTLLPVALTAAQSRGFARWSPPARPALQSNEVRSSTGGFLSASQYDARIKDPVRLFE